MKNIRLELLRFIHEQPLLYSSISTTCLVAFSSVGFILENSSKYRCRPDLFIWLLVVIVRSILRLIFSLARSYVIWKLSSHTTHNNNLWLSLRYFTTKAIEILDMAGLIWFTVGNVIVFIAAAACATTTPFIFAGCALYIGGWYAGILIPLWLRFSLRVFPPQNEEEQLYLQRLNSGLAIHHRGTLPRMDELQYTRESSADISSQQEAFWKQWLKLYGCEEFQFNAAEFSALHKNFTDAAPDMRCAICLIDFTTSDKDGAKDEEDPQQNVGDSFLPQGCSSIQSNQSISGVTAVRDIETDDQHGFADERITQQLSLNDIELQREVSIPADETASTTSDTVVRYPCASEQHFFHSTCLIHWLQVRLDEANSYRNTLFLRHRSDQYTHNVLPETLVEMRGYSWYREDSLTCPCCREMPTEHITSAPAEAT